MSFQQDQYVTMSIASLGESTLPRRDSRPFQEKKINDISDIDGARSGPKYQHYFNKPQFLQSDVQGSTSKSLSWSRNVRDNSLYIDDIDGTRHSIKDRMMRTSRHVDPLVPAYPLPSYVPAEDPSTKFIKDPLDHSDIDGSYSQPKKQFAPRDTMKIDDIAGTRPKRGPHYVDYGALAPTGPDISVPNHRFKDRTTRVTDPNNPTYHINGMEYQDDKYTKPKPLKKYIADNHLLQTKDITGATPGFKDTKFERRDYRNINFIQDIEGTQADSIKHSIVTKRQSNPLAPTYQSLDPGELLQPVVAPLIPPTMVKVPTIPVQRGSKVNSSDVPPSSTSAGGGGGGGVAERRSSPQYDDGDFEPVPFTTNVLDAGKPPSGRFQLDFTAPQNQSNGGGGYGGNSAGPSSRRSQQEFSPYNSARARQQQFGGGNSSRLSAAAANSFSASGSGYFDATGGSGGRTGLGGMGGTAGVSFQSPAPSARGSTGGGSGSARMTPNERRANLERAAEIAAVRGLQQ